MPVNYALAGHDIVFRVEDGAKRAAIQQPILAFEVDHVDEDQKSGWSVLVRGVGAEVDLERVPALLRAMDGHLPTPWATGIHNVWLQIGVAHRHRTATGAKRTPISEVMQVRPLTIGRRQTLGPCRLNQTGPTSERHLLTCEKPAGNGTPIARAINGMMHRSNSSRGFMTADMAGRTPSRRAGSTPPGRHSQVRTAQDAVGVAVLQRRDERSGHREYAFLQHLLVIRHQTRQCRA